MGIEVKIKSITVMQPYYGPGQAQGVGSQELNSPKEVVERLRKIRGQFALEAVWSNGSVFWLNRAAHLWIANHMETGDYAGIERQLEKWWQAV